MSHLSPAVWAQAGGPDGSDLSAITVSLIFFALNAGALSWVLWASKRRKRPKPPAPEPSANGAGRSTSEPGNGAREPVGPPDSEAADAGAGLDAADVLGWEFEYARTTASEAMQDRHTMVNFYLFITGIIGSGVVAVISTDSDLSPRLGTVLLWLLCGVGWLYFLKLVKLRQAWVDSARAMNQIKAFFIENVGVPGADLRDAFRWKPETLPPPDQPWTVFAYSASLIGFLDTAAFVGGGLLWATAGGSLSWLGGAGIAALGVAFFLFHLKLYFLFLREPGKERAGRRAG